MHQGLWGTFMKSYLLATCAFVGGCVLLSGCSTSGATFVPSFGVISSGYLTTGAERRVVSEVRPGEYSRPGLVDPQKIICAEPSPDVAKAVSQVISLGASAAAKTAEQNVDGSLALSASVAEGIASLVERTASIQLLRDKMYQTCLAYSNGAISGTTYSLIMSRLDESIVTLMLGESAAGAFGRGGASINAGGGGASGASLGLASLTTADAAQAATKLAEAQTAEEEAEKAVVAKKTEIANKQREIEEAEGDEEKKEQLETLKTQKVALEGELKTLETTAATATKTVENLTELYTGSMRAAAVAASRASAAGVGELRSQPDAEVAKIVSGIHTSFLEDDYNKVVISSCMVEMSQDTTGKGDPREEIDQLGFEIEANETRLSQLRERKTQLSEFGAGDRSFPPNPEALDREIDDLEDWNRISKERRKMLITLYVNGDMQDPLDRIANKITENFERTGNPKQLNDDALQQAVRIAEKRQSSALSRFCGVHLRGIVSEYSYKLNRVQENRYNIAYADAWATTMRAEADLIETCEAAETEQVKKWCTSRMNDLLQHSQVGQGLDGSTVKP